MKISKLEFHNFLGIKEIKINTGKVNIIKGRNGVGKTSILEAIEKTLSNNNRRVNLINETGQKAELVIELDNGLEVQRNITPKKDYLTIKRDGFTKNAPQTLLNELVGQFSFNPIDFIKEKSKNQAEILLNLVDIRVTPDLAKLWAGDIELPAIDYNQHGLKVIENLHKAFYDKRRYVNGELKAIEDQYAVEISKIPNNFDAEKYRHNTLLEKYEALKDAQAHNQKIDRAKLKITEIELTINEIELEKTDIINSANSRISEMEAKIQRLRDSIQNEQKNKNEAVKTFDSQLMELRKTLDRGNAYLEATEYTETTEIEREVEEFEENKNLVEIFDRAGELEVQMNQVQEEARELDSLVKILRNKPAELVEKASLPIDGLAFEKDQVTIKGRPIGDLSSSEKILLALNIARATAKDLKVICIDGIEAIVGDNRKLFLDEIENDDFQYFITQAVDQELEIETTLESGLKLDSLTGEILT